MYQVNAIAGNQVSYSSRARNRTLASGGMYDLRVATAAPAAGGIALNRQVQVLTVSLAIRRVFIFGIAWSIGWMGAAMDVFETIDRYMRVDLGGV